MMLSEKRKVASHVQLYRLCKILKTIIKQHFNFVSLDIIFTMSIWIHIYPNKCMADG